MGIISDFATGKKGEDIVKKELEKKGYICSAPDKANKSLYDILATKGKKQITFEVKNDRMFAITGNIAIEYCNSKKYAGSGILISEADFWVFILKNKPFIIHKETLLKVINNNQKLFTTKIGVGDGNSDILICKWTNIKKWFTTLKDFLEKKDVAV